MNQTGKSNKMKYIIIFTIVLVVIATIAGVAVLLNGGIPPHLQQVLP